jgi:hypothetical protein
MTPTIHRAIETCPICQDHLVITTLQCQGCETEIRGMFKNSVFCSLSPEDQAFAEMFIRLRGNVKEMERELGVAYNAVRNQLDRLIRNLGSEQVAERPPVPENPGIQVDRRAILDRLEQGEISADEAVELLSGSPTEKET